MSRIFYLDDYQVNLAPNQNFIPAQRHHQRSYQRQLPVPAQPTPSVRERHLLRRRLGAMPQFLRLLPELEIACSQRDAGTQIVNLPVHHGAPRPMAYDYSAPPMASDYPSRHVEQASPPSRGPTPAHLRMDGEGEDVIDEWVEAYGQGHQEFDHIPAGRYMAPSVEDTLDLDYRMPSISRSSSGNGISTPTNRHPGYLGEGREVNEAPTEAVASQQVEGGSEEETVEHTLNMIVVNMNDLLAQAIELVQVQRQVVNALERLQQDMVRAVQDLELESEEEIVQEEARPGVPTSSAVVEDWTPEKAKRP